MGVFTVTPAEAGQKLLQALARRTGAGPSVLHKWIRTGQVRVNGGRRKAFDRIDEGDEVRIPPFAELRQSGIPEDTTGADASANAGRVSDFPHARAKPDLDIPILFQSKDIIVINKPAGVAVQPGSGQNDSIADWLKRRFTGAPFVPAPAHRLDRDTSGLLLAGASYAGQRSLSDAFSRHAGITKEYLAWCLGSWTYEGRLRTRLAKKAIGGRDLVRTTSDGLEALMDIRPVRTSSVATLVHIRLITGRTHQIRAQLCSQGHAIVGDGKYGGRPACAPFQGLLLHAARIIVDGRTFEVLPPWQGAWAVKELPLPF